MDTRINKSGQPEEETGLVRAVETAPGSNMPGIPRVVVGDTALKINQAAGIKIDVQARHSVISKLEDVAETARSFAPPPMICQTFCPVKCLQ